MSWSLNRDTVENWVHYERLFTPEECQEIIKIGLSSKLYPGVINNNSVLNADIRESKVVFFSGDEAPDFFNKISLVTKLLNEKYFGFHLWGFAEGWQFTEYQAPTGHYDTHIDKMLGGHIRKLTTVIQLSDPEDYEGGELHVMVNGERDPIVMKKSIGCYLAFPSYVLHRLTPVTKGTRYSLVGWVTGDCFK